MYYKISPRLIPALLAVAFSGAASASGFQLLGEQSASSLGNAGAGSAAVAENAGTIFYNPAGMTELVFRPVNYWHMSCMQSRYLWDGRYGDGDGATEG